MAAEDRKQERVSGSHGKRVYISGPRSRYTDERVGLMAERSARRANSDFALLMISFRVAYAVMQSDAARVPDWLDTRGGLLLSVARYSVAAGERDRAGHHLAGGSSRLGGLEGVAVVHFPAEAVCRKACSQASTSVTCSGILLWPVSSARSNFFVPGITL